MLDARLIQSYEKLRETAGLVTLAGRGTVVLTGGDRALYLQGLLTNDIAALTAGTGCYAAYLTPQGRMIADMRVFEIGDRMLLDVDRKIADTLTSRLSMLVFSENVQVIDESAAWYRVGVRGPEAAARVEEILTSTGLASDSKTLIAYRDLNNGWWTLDGEPLLAASNDELGVPGIDLWISSVHDEHLNARLNGVGLELAHPAAVEALRVEAGTPRFGIDMDQDTIPLEAGIETRAISETKGCYVGQEVIIRILHRGKGRIARRLVGLTFAKNLTTAPAAGSLIYLGDEMIGKVTSAVRSPRLDRPIALAYLQREHATPGTRVETGGGPVRAAAEVTVLPFPSSPI
ncbi:MAG: hypothetical protein MK358_09655 [Vicinamibacterales bacterium]|nr:hypothetical protein [Vicinamibacterales bacterium]